ncbi:MAG: DUF502 domain-containing protein [Sphingobacteriales bacterium]|uniref:DUF502 domain-containing protein n=1 Tax=Hydrotalea flava TaxID=714549 RepID=UPI00082D3E76|nr:DUF502 domain-containing protein [Hydrotalea flava]RTL50005.1 MAG: DUF502 domain-containing protein [Sphingobacteriales bacterium]
MKRERFSLIFQLFLRNIFKYFLQGLAVLAPIGITIWLVISLFNFIDGILPNIIHSIFPSLIKVDTDGSLKRIPGVGFIVVLTLVLLVGRISSSFIFSKIVEAFDSILEHTPGVKFIYSSVKDFFEAFSGNKKKFDKPVMVNVDATDVWRMGFITNKDAAGLNLPDHIVVYVPHSYAISGITYIVPKDRVRIIRNLNAADAMKFIISGGITEHD